MRAASLLAILGAAASVLAWDVQLPRGVPTNEQDFRKKHPYNGPTEPCEKGRRLVTMRSSKNATDDVADEFLAALRKANRGGTLYLPEGKTYMIGKPLDLTFLDNVQVHLNGVIKFTNDTPYWQANSFHHPFQNSIMFWKWGGKNIKIYGGGSLDGNGQRWWNEFAGLEILDPTNAYLRPILFYAENATNLQIEGIHLRDSPCWTTFIVTSKDISFKDVICTAESNNATALPKNTDFFDSLNVENVSVKRTWVNIGDDCFSPKSNGTNLHVDTMYCNGTHGQSIGSLGQYAGEKSFIKNALIENVWLLNGQHGARIKTWAGQNIGYGFVENVTFRNLWQANNEYSAFIDSCYFNINSTTCAQYPSRMNLTNISFENFSGYTSGKYGRVVAKLTCSTNPNAVCDNISFKNFNVTSPCGGPPVIICDGIKGGIGVDCVSSNSAEAKAALADKCSVPLAELEDDPW